MNKNFKMLFTVFVTTALLGSFGSSFVHADETVKEKVSEAGNDAKRAVKKGARKVKDETCEMINGKMKCVANKIKHSAQNAGDAIEDAID